MVRSPSAGHRPTGPATTAAVLVVGAASSGAAAWLVLAGHRAAGGVLALLAAVALILRPRTPDVRRLEQAVFARRVLHRVFEAAVLASVAWVERTGSIRVAILALVCLGSSYVASYQRARGEGLGYHEEEGTAYRATTAVLPALALLTGWIEPVLWAFAAITASAGMVRAANVAVQERRAPRRGTLSS